MTQNVGDGDVEDGELTKEATCRNFRQVRKEGSREVTILDLQNRIKNRKSDMIANKHCHINREEE